MPLYCAAQWVATKGGRVAFDPESPEIWQSAYRDLLEALSSENVRVVGSRNGIREPVPGYHFVGCDVEYPYDGGSLEMILNEDLYLRSYPYIDDHHWKRGFDDALVHRHGDKWNRLMVSKADVRSRWPFESTPSAASTGAPGRPTSAHLIKAELERRAAAGHLLDLIGQEARALSTWLASEHPDMPPAKHKAIETIIRTRYWELRGRK